jgi:ComF family protein
MRLIKKILWFLIDFVIPPRCILCQAIIITPGYVCGECWGKLSLISNPYCDQCGFPFEFEVDAHMACGPCLKNPPAYGKARSTLVYDDASKSLILKFKHGDGTYLAPAFTDWMFQAGAELFTSADFLIPVPLHWQRLIRRRYNQAALLTKGLAHKTKKPALLNALKRIKNTPSQGHLTASEREQNVKNAFTLNPRYTNRLKGKRVLLIDDVLTSGATIKACTKVLLKHEILSVDILTLARTVKSQS